MLFISNLLIVHCGVLCSIDSIINLLIIASFQQMSLVMAWENTCISNGEFVGKSQQTLVFFSKIHDIATQN